MPDGAAEKDDPTVTNAPNAPRPVADRALKAAGDTCSRILRDNAAKAGPRLAIKLRAWGSKKGGVSGWLVGGLSGLFEEYADDLILLVAEVVDDLGEPQVAPAPVPAPGRGR